jgi:hypothetical protein
VTDGAYAQSDAAAENTMITAGDPTWQNYDLSVKSTEQSGRGGFRPSAGRAERERATFHLT